ncbi:MAG TPA: hypothetical protein VNO35_24660 [Steroidobacteraceae bacterium]|nr:hypothetical protein [Steroidobacteraceae bacterium]
MSIEDRGKQVLTELFEACSANEQGQSRVDGAKITTVVRRDPAAVAFAVQKILTSPLAGQVGWSMWLVTAKVFEHEHGDDSLVVMVEAAAAAAGAKLPRVLSSTPHEPEPQRKLLVLQMAEADVAAGDAHRMLMVMRLEGLSTELRAKMLGNCIITFPALGDDRPVQHIRRVRAFVADLHRRMPYFPVFLDFDDRHGMRMVYFGCLADTAATEVRPDGAVGTNMGDPSVLEAIKTSLVGIRRACSPLGIDWKPCAEAMIAPYDAEIRRTLLGAY